MMGQQKSELFNYAVNLERRVRANHPLRQVKAAIDFGFVREEVAHCYGKNGNELVPPEVILKIMFLLFFDEIKSAGIDGSDREPLGETGWQGHAQAVRFGLLKFDFKERAALH